MNEQTVPINPDMGKPGGAVGETARMNEQKVIARRNRKRGPAKEKPTIQTRFERFHERNPDVYAALVAYARKLKAAGFDSYGIVGLFEVLRYDRSIKTDGKPFKLSNDFRSRYARLIMDQEPDLVGYFRTKELTSL